MSRRKRRARRRKFFRKIINAGSNIIKNKTGVDLGKIKPQSKSSKPSLNFNIPSTVTKPSSNDTNISSPSLQSAMDRVEVSNSSGTYEGGNFQKVKDWFTIKYHTAKGAFIGCIVGATIVTIQLLGIYDFFQLFSSKKRRVRRRR